MAIFHSYFDITRGQVMLIGTVNHLMSLEVEAPRVFDEHHGSYYDGKLCMNIWQSMSWFGSCLVEIWFDIGSKTILLFRRGMSRVGLTMFDTCSPVRQCFFFNISWHLKIFQLQHFQVFHKSTLSITLWYFNIATERSTMFNGTIHEINRHLQPCSLAILTSPEGKTHENCPSLHLSPSLGWRTEGCETERSFLLWHPPQKVKMWGNGLESMERPWKIYVKSMEFLWKIFGKSMVGKLEEYLEIYELESTVGYKEALP